ncbi:YdeI/OmpD-associated family protein [Limimaricola hongkongensis]|uniref:YdhG-like domain-containing protein n=1 Tax=Limimaricola hongkongensis DSM 17492 TaxID=1122180 RepID=A0A017HG44_9RHOB|nr:YdeI/OmpD-associated family protein [Limimaricola hongkongensis]EYD73290.1 hypothetical protein Lokhon_00818 [Limimaricola hongkongensis DSM 17492]
MGASAVMITDIEDFFSKGCGRCARFDTPDCAALRWQAGLRDLRRICLDMGLVETVKWAHPCYMHAGRNIALLGALRAEIRLGFFNPALLSDPEKVLERNGPNTRHPDMIRLRSSAEVAGMEPVIRAYLAEAMRHAELGTRPPKVQDDLELPEELRAAIDADPELAGAFSDLTPGRRKSYVIALASAKKPETRIARIERFRGRILAGKGAQER